MLSWVRQHNNPSRPITIASYQNTASEEAAALGLFVFDEFVTVEEELGFSRCADEALSEMPYAGDHYDSVITQYRECPMSDFPDLGADAAFRRMRMIAWQATNGAPRRGRGLYPYAQVIDLSPDGKISAHRDNMKLFGEFTAGLNLLSPAVMRFRPMAEAEKDRHIDVLLKPRTLYVMSGALRWQWTHEVLDNNESAAVWADDGGAGDLARGRRISGMRQGSPNVRRSI